MTENYSTCDCVTDILPRTYHALLTIILEHELLSHFNIHRKTKIYFLSGYVCRWLADANRNGRRVSQRSKCGNSSRYYNINSPRWPHCPLLEIWGYICLPSSPPNCLKAENGTWLWWCTRPGPPSSAVGRRRMRMMMMSAPPEERPHFFVFVPFNVRWKWVFDGWREVAVTPPNNRS